MENNPPPSSPPPLWYRSPRDEPGRRRPKPLRAVLLGAGGIVLCALGAVWFGAGLSAADDEDWKIFAVAIVVTLTLVAEAVAMFRKSYRALRGVDADA